MPASNSPRVIYGQKLEPGWIVEYSSSDASGIEWQGTGPRPADGVAQPFCATLPAQDVSSSHALKQRPCKLSDLQQTYHAAPQGPDKNLKSRLVQCMLYAYKTVFRHLIICCKRHVAFCCRILFPCIVGVAQRLATDLWG